MKNVFIVADNIISPLGNTTDQNFLSIKKGLSGIRQHNDPAISSNPFYASLLSKNDYPQSTKNASFTKFEELLIASVRSALEGSPVDISDTRTVLIISSTKGNIGLIENSPVDHELKSRVALHTSARLVAGYFKCANKPVLISNACISGSLAILVGRRLIRSGQYDHAIVTGADLVSKFIFSGFESFQAISSRPCRPFDAARDGITLGEGAATIVLSASKVLSGIKITGGSVSNDANHISGPSRTGDELCQAITRSMAQASLTENDIDLISAHGTATIYNDEMEALAISTAKLQGVPLNSLKGYYGHTLGAAGIIETVISARSLKEGIILPSRGFSNSGVTKPLNVSSFLQTSRLKNCLKTASGFGGCNAALVINNENI